MAGSPLDPLPIGTVVHERYRILAIVGRGGLGTVYQVSDILFGKNNVYALKELADQSSGARKQFELESLWLQSLDHKNIPKFREHFEWEQRLYLVMDFVDGENLEQKLARLGGRPLTEQQVLAWTLPICDALHYLHSRTPPILHRDVKPANIIVTKSGHPVLVDLGIAKEHLPGAGQTATFVRKAGTEGYAPPEQYTTAGQTGPWSDVYGLGATLYQLLTGGIPPTAVERVALDAKLLPPRAINPSISVQADAAISRALAIRPADRFASVVEFARALSGQRPPGTAPLSYSSAYPSVPSPASIPRPESPPPTYPSAPSAPSAPSVPSVPSAPSAPSVPSYAPNTRSRPGGYETGALRAAPPSRQGTAPKQPARAATRERHGGQRASDEPAPAPAQGAWPALAKSPVVLGTGLACVLVVAIVLTVAVLRATTPPDRSTPRATIAGYFSALSTRDYARAWQYVTESRNDANGQTTFISGLRSDEALHGQVLSAAITDLEDNAAGKASAQVRVTYAQPRGTVLTYSLELTQYGGDTWLIDSVAST